MRPGQKVPDWLVIPLMLLGAGVAIALCIAFPPAVIALFLCFANGFPNGRGRPTP